MMQRRGWAGWVGVVMGVALFAASAANASPQQLPVLTARSAFMTDGETGDVLYALDPDAELPPASTTKVLTALVAVRMGELDRNVMVSRYASSVEPSKIYLKPGWTMNVEDLLYAILLNSANDASVAIAEGLGGSVENYARLMTSTAHELGAANSNFVNPNGLPNDAHYTTARDLVTILRHALQRPVIRQVLSTPTTVIQPRSGSKRRIALRSHNRFLMRRDVRVIGKTGYTRSAKRCFVGAASAGDREIFFAVLGSTDLWGDVDRLISFGLEHPSEQPGWPTGAEWVRATQRDDSEWRAAAAVPPRTQRHSKAVEAMARAAAAIVQPAPAEASDFHYELHLASFRTRAQADRLRSQVAARGYQVLVEETQTRRKQFLVRVVGFSTRDSARKAARALGKAHRVDPQIVAVRA